MVYFALVAAPTGRRMDMRVTPGMLVVVVMVTMSMRMSRHHYR